MTLDVAGPEPEASGFRVAWFGHGEGRRADGLSTYSREVVRSLERRGCAVRFFLHEHDGDRAPVDDPVRLGARRFKTVTIPRRGSARRIEAALDVFRPDVVHCSWSFSLQDGRIGDLGRRLGATTVATFHLPYADQRSVRGLVMRGLYRYHVRHLRSYDRCLALSEGQRDLLVEAGYPASRIVVVPNGVDAEGFSPGPSDLRERLGAAFVVTYIGRLDPEKRVVGLVEAFLRLGWPDDHVLVLAGGGSQAQRIERLAQGRRNVRLLGVVTDPAERRDLLRGTDVCVLPSTAEGLSLSLLEAMASGCAVVATAVGDDGRALDDAGVLIPVRPLEPGLRDALNALREDASLRALLGAKARARAVSRYAMSSTVDSVLDVYRELRGGAATPPGAAGYPGYLGWRA